MDAFKRSYGDIATAYDIYDKNVIYNNRVKSKDKKMMHRLGRSRLKSKLIRECKEVE